MSSFLARAEEKAGVLVRRALGAEVRERLSELVLAQGGALFHCGDSHERVDQVVRPAQGPRL